MPCHARWKTSCIKCFFSNKMHLKRRYLRYLLPRHFCFWSFLLGLLMIIFVVKSYSFKMRFSGLHNLTWYRLTYNLDYIPYTTFAEVDKHLTTYKHIIILIDRLMRYYINLWIHAWAKFVLLDTFVMLRLADENMIQGIT